MSRQKRTLLPIAGTFKKPGTMQAYRRNTSLNFLFAAVWLANGLFCKILNLVPRHRLIVQRITGAAQNILLTDIIALSEVLMAAWIIIGYRPRLNALTQMLIIALMNMLEFFLAPDLLLWGRFNALFAFLFIVLIGINEYVWKTRPQKIF